MCNLPRFIVKASVNNIGILAILIVGFLLRAEEITQPLVDKFSWRESSTAMMADNLPLNSWNPLWPEVSWTGDQRGYQGREFQSLSIAAAALDEVFGWRDWHGRVVALICGLISIYALYRLVTILAGRNQALLTSGLYAVLPGAVVVDRAYLPEPAMLAFTLVGIWFAAEGLARRQTTFLFAGWLFVTFGLLAKLMAVAALPAILYLVLLGGRPAITVRRIAIATVALLASAAIVFSYYSWAVYLGRTYPPFHIAGHGWIWQVGFTDYWNNGFYLYRVGAHLIRWLWGAVVLALALIGFWITQPTDRKVAEERPLLPAPLFFHAWAIGSAILFLLAARELKSNPWNFHIFNPAAAGLAGATLVWLSGEIFRRLTRLRTPLIAGVTNTAVLIGFMALVAATTRQGIEFIREPSYALADYQMGVRMSDLACPNELVAVSGSDVGMPTAIYYSRRHGFVFPPPDHPGNRNYGLFVNDGDEAISIIRDFARRGTRWFGFTHASKDDLDRLFSEHHTSVIAFLDTYADRVDNNDVFTIYDLAKMSGKVPAPCKASV